MDVSASEVVTTTYTQIVIRPTVISDREYVTVEVRIDNVHCGRGTGKTIGEALVAVGLDMMGLQAWMLAATLELVREVENRRDA